MSGGVSWPGLHATGLADVEQIAAERRKSAFFAALDEVNRKIADEQLQAEAFAAAVGEHTCVCGSGIYFTPDSTLDDYAELNRWLGHHGRCPEVAQLESTRMALIGSVRHLSPRQPLG